MRVPTARELARADARAAAEEIIREAKGRSLGAVTIKELIDEGRRG